MTIIRAGFVIGDFKWMDVANYCDVNFNKNIDPIIWPVIWLVTPTLDTKCACFNYFLAKLSKDISCKVTNAMDTNNNIAIL